MFNVIDKEGHPIYIRDKVNWDNSIGFCVGYPNENNILFLMEDGGLPLIVRANEVIVVESFTRSVSELESYEELQKILGEAEQRLADWETNHKTKGKATSKPKAKQQSFNIEL